MSDEAFRTNETERQKVLAEEGIAVPEGKEIKVVGNIRDETYLVIPYAEEGLMHGKAEKVICAWYNFFW